MAQLFTEKEVQKLNEIILKGGIFIQIYDNPTEDVIVYKADNNGDFIPLLTLEDNLAKKFYDLRGENVPSGFHMLSLGYVINKYI